MVQLDGRRPCAVPLAKVVVEGQDRIIRSPDPQQGLDDVDGLQVVRDFTARRQIGSALLEQSKGLLKVRVGFTAADQRLQEGPHFDQERAVVANIVNHLQLGLPFRLAQSAAKLLQPNCRGLRGAQHQHRVDRWDVEAFIEHVNGKDNVDVAVGKFL